MVMINKGKTREQYQSHVNTTTARTRRLHKHNRRIAQMGKIEKHESVYMFREAKGKQDRRKNKWNTKEKKIGEHMKQGKMFWGRKKGLIPAAIL